MDRHVVPVQNVQQRLRARRSVECAEYRIEQAQGRGESREVGSAFRLRVVVGHVLVCHRLVRRGSVVAAGLQQRRQNLEHRVVIDPRHRGRLLRAGLAAGRGNQRIDQRAAGGVADIRRRDKRRRRDFRQCDRQSSAPPATGRAPAAPIEAAAAAPGRDRRPASRRRRSSSIRIAHSRPSSTATPFWRFRKFADASRARHAPDHQPRR